MVWLSIFAFQTERHLSSIVLILFQILFRMIQPQRLFFMAVDGVAPRAKMNQQRGRRYVLLQINFV